MRETQAKNGCQVQKYKMLIDTDPGVDDAMAILMAHERAEVIGLSVAAGNVGLEHTLANALKLVEVIDTQTPVYAGCATPLVHASEDAADVHGSDGFGDTAYTPSTRSAESEHAALAILRASHEYAGSLVLVALAPLTNLALALKLDPDLPLRVARLVVMGGAVTGQGNYGTVPAEFNVGFDPEAAHVVFSAWPQFTLVDWEATMRHGLDFARFEAMLARGDARAKFYDSITAKTRAWSRGRGRPKLLIADALAMAVALEPDIVTRAEDHHVGVELDGKLTRGATVVDWQDRNARPANARIVLEVDQSRFEALLAAAVGAG
ncbi:MAG: nucleoside hydrolase [Proteobacteria bacterium]|uniref:nucleoside hydrolase n=1 Tax=Rudaea sp. TaxID=2136325 RepID=UPI001DBFC41F|nr:nucleoside hydrolase [Pseudomonadota bacterium]MBS0566324.1 nucleoside hydrolase [Pseudomonadota bacterium]